MPRTARPELSLRIAVEKPLPDVLLMLQRGRADLVAPTSLTRKRATFDFTVRVGPARIGRSPHFLGPFTQGPPAARFVYINAGRRAGQAGTPWDRRAKIPLTGITQAQVKAALARPGGRLEVHIAGRGSDGGPTCATVRLAPLGAAVWRVCWAGS